jgi:hypothetical protein
MENMAWAVAVAGIAVAVGIYKGLEALAQAYREASANRLRFDSGASPDHPPTG